ncbi:MAG: phenylacetate--CoA ligase family protein [Actinomycetota bacterium]
MAGPEGALWNPAIQTMPRDQLLALQAERLREAVARAAEMPFWKAKLDAGGAAPDDVKTADDLLRIPRTVKDELRADQAANPPFGSYQSREGAVRMGTTTGTTGTPTMILWTRRDLEVEHEGAARMFWRYGTRPGQLVVHSHPLGIYGGGAILSSALEAFGALVAPVGSPGSDEDAEKTVRMFQALRPDQYFMFENTLLRYWEAAERMGLKPAEDLGMRPRMEHPVLQSATGTAGAECFSFLGGGCMQFQGAHICEDFAVVECLDPATGLPQPDQTRGHLVVTTIGRDNVMLRYDLEDIIRLDREPCACGETHMRMLWDGRAKDLVNVRGKELLPVDVWWVLEDFPELKAPMLEYVLVRRPGNDDTLEIRIEGEAVLGDQIATKIEEKLSVPARVSMQPRGSIPRPEFKPVRVVDEP